MADLSGNLKLFLEKIEFILEVPFSLKEIPLNILDCAKQFIVEYPHC